MNNLSDTRLSEISTRTGAVPTILDARKLADELIRLRAELKDITRGGDTGSSVGITLQQLMPNEFGSQTRLANELKINRATLRKYLLNDRAGRFHRIINGVFMTAPINQHKRDSEECQ